MNLNSVAHSYVQNQQPSSWIDDPFQLGTRAFQGLGTMSNEQSLSDYTAQLVSQYAKYSHDQYDLNVDMLPEEEQNTLAKLYIESIDREIEWACYGADASINSDFLCALLAMLKDDNAVTRERFAEVTRNNIITYYKPTLNDILVTACDNFLYMMHEQAYYYNQDLEVA